MEEPRRILVVDDEPKLREAWERFLTSENGFDCVGTLARADDLEAVTADLRPDLILLDLSMPGKDPLAALRETLNRHPDIRAVVYSGYDDPETVRSVIDAGAWGFVDKLKNPASVLQILKRVADGEFAFP